MSGRVDDIRDILAGSKLAGSKLIRLLEDGESKALDMIKNLYPKSGNAFIIGITGSPGVGKSTLIDALISELRAREYKVAVLAVDPSSPISGGAILGDRIRMQKHAEDENVFIRSMASRGQQGGVARSVRDASVVFDAMGFDVILIETVGAGQTQFDIKNLAHTIGVVTIPGTGDGIQAVKAGILETGDIFIVNKIDRPGVEESVFQLENMIHMKNPDKKGWTQKVIQTRALDGTGVKQLADAFFAHLDFMKQNEFLNVKKQEMDKSYFNFLVKDIILNRISVCLQGSKAFSEIRNMVESGMKDPVSAAQMIADKMIIQAE